MRHIHRNEFNGWKAVAHTYYGAQHLLYMGSSSEHVKKNYPSSFYELLTKPEQMGVDRVTLQRWSGKSNCGRWIIQDQLKVPHINTRF